MAFICLSPFSWHFFDPSVINKLLVKNDGRMFIRCFLIVDGFLLNGLKLILNARRNICVLKKVSLACQVTVKRFSVQASYSRVSEKN